MAEREARYETSEPFWGGNRSPLTTLHESASSDYRFSHSSVRKTLCCILDGHVLEWSLAIFPYPSNSGLCLPKFVFLRTSRIFQMLSYRSRLGLFRVQYYFQYNTISIELYLGILKRTSHFQLAKNGRCCSCSLMYFPRHIKTEDRDFPGGPEFKNLPCNARDVGSSPGRGTKVSHAMGQLSPCALEPTCHN